MDEERSRLIDSMDEMNRHAAIDLEWVDSQQARVEKAVRAIAGAPIEVFHRFALKRVEWLVCTDVGLVIVSDGIVDIGTGRFRLIADLTLWRDVRDVEVKYERLQMGETDASQIELTIQVPRFGPYRDVSPEFAAFVRELVRLANR